MKRFIKNNQGQALITLLFISVIGMAIIAAAAIFIFQNILGASVTEQGVGSYYVAEAGVQEALLRMLRNPNYTGTPANQPLSIKTASISGSVVIQVSTSSGIITSVGTYNNSVRKIQVQTVYNNGVLNISSWKEVQ